MMIYSQSSILDRTVSREVLQKLVFLWEEIAVSNQDRVLLLTETDLIQQSHSANKITERDWQWDNFKLLAIGQWQALLLIKSEFNNNHKSAQISLTFDIHQIEIFLDSIREQLLNKQTLFDRLQQIKNQALARSSELQNRFILELLSILTAPETVESLVPTEISLNEKITLFRNNSQIKSVTETNLLPNQTYLTFTDEKIVAETPSYQVEQQRIFNQVQTQISQNLDLLDIFTMTIEQVRNSLKVDRLVIYQLNVPLKYSNNHGEEREYEYIDTVTYESRASDRILSILNFHKENCFSKSSQCKEKYRQGFSLAVEDVENHSNLPKCLIELMQRLRVKAKLVTPIIIHGTLWGFIIAHQCFAPRKWRNIEIKFLRQISEYLAIAIYQNESYLQLQQQKKSLEEQVKKRAQQLQDALLAAQAASQSKNEFIGNMSHELRTPLTCVIGLSGTLLHWSLAQGNTTLPLEKQRQYLKTIQDSGKHLLDLVNDILDFSEAESGKILLNFSDFSLYGLAKSVLKALQDEADKKEIDLQLDFKLETEQEQVYADRDRVKQILLNLLNNGIKFTSENGKVILRIWREQQEMIFEVEDTGIGISQENLPLLFEKFQQLESSRQRTHGGTGLGLALTKQLVELHGGRIEVESVVGQGSIFTVYLPNQNSTKPKTERHQEIIDPNHVQSKTIILIAQDEEISTLICELLMAANYQVVWLIDDSTAIQQIGLLEPSIVIIDRESTQIDIENISKTLKHFHKTKDIKVMLLSSRLTDSQSQDLSAQGIDDYLIKPIQPTYLLEKIGGLIS
jgi:two-component system sensor histidine kinase/response regulator